MIETLKINVAYDEILEINEIQNKIVSLPNLSRYEIEPQWMLWLKENQLNNFYKYKQLSEFLDNTHETFIENTIDFFYENNLEFIYPIILYDNILFTNYQTIELNQKLIESVKNKKAKIVFFQLTESYFGQSDNEFIWLDNLAVKYDFDIDGIMVITANFCAVNLYKNNKFKIYPYSYFTNQLTFLNLKTLNKSINVRYNRDYLKYINNNRTNNKEKHFLCFNGVPRLNRIAIFAEIKTNEKLVDKTILTLRGRHFFEIKHFYNVVNKGVDDSYDGLKNRLLNFLENYDSRSHTIYDIEDLESLEANGGPFINYDAHSKTFVNIITETTYNKRSVFFTEKTSKPIYMCQPFIYFGSPYQIKELQKLGYKTFNKWWDESYDDELNFTKRMEKVVTIMEEIASWDLNKCHNVMQEMEEVLIHNFNRLCNNNSDVLSLYDLLKTHTVKKTRII